MTDALSDLRDARASVSATLDSFPESALGWCPEPDVWSATDVLEHLVLAERGALFAIDRQLAAGDDRKDLGPPSAERFAQLSAFLRSDQKARVPEAAARFIAPSREAPYADLRTEWNGLDVAWRDRFASITGDLANVAMMRHAVAGPLTAESTARFIADHMRHHLHQLRRLRESEGFPSE